MTPAEEELRDRKRKRLRIFGLTLWILGIALCTVGAINIFSSYAQLLKSIDAVGADPTGQTPKYAWCIYVGIPPLAIGTAIRFYLKSRRW